MENKKKSDGLSKGVIIAIALMVVFFIVMLIVSMNIVSNNLGDKIAKIYKDGELIQEIDLNKVSESYTIKIDSENGNYNIVRVENGRISVSDASCPDKICVNTGYITNGSVPISCLPNKLIIKIEDSETQESPDAVVN